MKYAILETNQHSPSSHGPVDVKTWSSQVQIEIETQSCPDPPLKRDTELLRPALEVKRGVAQTRVWRETRSCSDPRL